MAVQTGNTARTGRAARAGRTGETALPKTPRLQKTALRGFLGLDRRPGLREGYLSACAGLDPRALPALAAMPAPVLYNRGPAGETLCLQVLGTALFRVYAREGSLYLARYGQDGSYTAISLPGSDLTTPRTLLAYNLYSNPSNPLSGSYRHMALLFPDKLLFAPDSLPLSVELLGGSNVPNIDTACVHLSRVFGVHEDRLYASAFNNPRDWSLDTASNIHASHAWASTVQSNTRASGHFTALTVYGGQVLAFKRRFCHILYNNKNPFRIGDLLTVGARDSRTVAEVGGKLFFVGEEGVYRYNGDSATLLSEALGTVDYSGALAVGAAGLYWLYLPSEGQVFLWSEERGGWGALPVFGEGRIAAMAATPSGCCLIDEDGCLYTTEGGRYGDFSATTAPVLSEAVGRTTRLSAAVTAEEGATFSLAYTDTQGRHTPLLAGVGNGRSRRVESRAFTPADYGGSLHLAGHGNVTLHDMIIETAES